MKSKPILFSAPMILALLDGRKTQTRRIAKVNNDDCKPGFITPNTGFVPRPIADHAQYCPYGVPGDLLYVKETHEFIHYRGGAGIHYKADGAEIMAPAIRSYTPPLHRGRPSIYMPRWASRLTLRITDARVERLQEISEADSVAEGCNGMHDFDCSAGHNELGAFHPDQSCRCGSYSPSEVYARLWESINGTGSWNANPFVWCIAFDTIHANVDTVT